MIWFFLRSVWIVTYVATLALLAQVLLAAKAHAECPCGSHLVYVKRDWPRADGYARICNRYCGRVYGYERRYDDRYDPHDQCLDREVDVLSTEHQSEEAAREAARKLWMAKVQWIYGGQFMDFDKAARGVIWRCGPSSPMDTISGRIAEAAGTLTGRGGQNMRCALRAHPCRTERTLGDERAR